MLKKYFLLFIAFGVTFFPAFSQCAETDQTKVLLVGDSWAFFMGVDQTIDNALQRWGHSHYKFFTNATIAENGAETDDFLKPDKQAEIIAQLDAHPEIEVVHLSIGGNDFLGDWNVNFTQAQTDSLMQAVEVRLLQVIDFIKSTKPGIRILWSGYTYPNFEEVIEDAAPFQTNHPFYGTWEGMGFPNFLQINSLLDSVAHEMEIYTNSDPQVDYVNAPGILQHTFGQIDPVTVAPNGTYPAYTAPLPYGYPDYPTPKDGMRNYFLTKDCFHLSPKGYDDMLDYQMQKFYHKFLMDDQYFLAAGVAQNGSVSSAGNVATTLQVGENGGENFATALSFNTTNMPDTVLTAASIFLRRESLTGTNPIGSTLQVKIVHGNFGASADVEAGDWNANADATDMACVFGSNSNDGHWIRLDLPASMLPFIHQAGNTQFLISAPNATNGIFTFSNTNDPDFAPVLNVTFKHLSVDVASGMAENQDKVFYPNPTQDVLKIDNEQVKEIFILNSLGEKVLKPILIQGKIDVSTLPAGLYWVHVYTEKGLISQKMIKE